ncbi:prestalk protein-like [Patella vulgata]|uniref:prestalk protein-like n=1 Tax=Patella vulgata TaxID=6465 RepID=UPI0024A8D511|nr:prestalk protein-like [Patella vulgata]
MDENNTKKISKQEEITNEDRVCNNTLCDMNGGTCGVFTCKTGGESCGSGHCPVGAKCVNDVCRDIVGITAFHTYHHVRYLVKRGESCGSGHCPVDAKCVNDVCRVLCTNDLCMFGTCDTATDTCNVPFCEEHFCWIIQTTSKSFTRKHDLRPPSRPRASKVNENNINNISTQEEIANQDRVCNKTQCEMNGGDCSIVFCATYETDCGSVVCNELQVCINNTCTEPDTLYSTGLCKTVKCYTTDQGESCGSGYCTDKLFEKCINSVCRVRCDYDGNCLHGTCDTGTGTCNVPCKTYDDCHGTQCIGGFCSAPLCGEPYCQVRPTTSTNNTIKNDLRPKEKEYSGPKPLSSTNVDGLRSRASRMDENNTKKISKQEEITNEDRACNKTQCEMNGGICFVYKCKRTDTVEYTAFRTARFGYFVEQGESCGSGHCPFNAKCINDVCRVPCGHNHKCTGGSCDTVTGTCNVPCDTPADCTGFQCIGGTCYTPLCEEQICRIIQTTSKNYTRKHDIIPPSRHRANNLDENNIKNISKQEEITNQDRVCNKTQCDMNGGTCEVVFCETNGQSCGSGHCPLHINCINGVCRAQCDNGLCAGGTCDRSTNTCNGKYTSFYYVIDR